VEVCCGPGQAPAAPPAELLAAAADGTLILHDVDALSPPGQAVLLRALQARDADAPGAARLVVTASPELPDRAAAGTYRSDLFYRLNVFPIAVPSLRDRAEDLLPLATDLLVEAAAAAGRPTLVLSRAAAAALQGRALPGNVPELRELIRRAVVRSSGGAVEPRDLFDELPAAASFPGSLPLDLVELERLAITEALRRVNGNRTQAARLLNIGLRTLRNKLRAWRDAGEEIPPSPRARPDVPASPGPGAGETAAILARSWARRSQIERA
jgi:DNA-binding NtrC family response regulator